MEAILHASSRWPKYCRIRLPRILAGRSFFVAKVLQGGTENELL